MRHLLHDLPGEVPLTPDSATRHRLRRVLRLDDGAALTLCDGRGRTQAVRWRQETLVPDDAIVQHPALHPPLHVAPGVLKGERFDWLVEKASELGVDVLTPLLLDHAVVKVADRQEKQARWQVTADSALEQCGRTWRMTVALPQTLDQWLAMQTTTGHFADETGGAAWSEIVRSPTPAGWHITLGVEGGWSAREREVLSKRGWTPVSIGPLVLRAETACLAVAAVARAQSSP